MRATTLAIAGALAAIACDDESEVTWKDDYEFVRHGDQVTVYGYGWQESDVCGGSISALDAQTRAVMDVLGAQTATAHNYRWVSPESIGDLCPIGVNACTEYGEPYAQALPHMHEIVHMIDYPMPGTGCTALLEEGLGEYLGDPRYWDGPELDYDIVELMQVREHPGSRGYLRAGHFVSFIVETYGVLGLRRLCEESFPIGTIPGWDWAIRIALGVSLDELLVEYERYPPCTQQQYRARLWECSGAPDHVFTPDDRSFVVDAGCDDPRAMNVTPGELGDAVVWRLVYFAEDTWVDVTPGSGAAFMSQECAPCSANPQVERERENTLNLHHFRAGLHEVLVFFERTEPVHFRMSALPD